MEEFTEQEVFLGYCEQNSVILLTEYIKTRPLNLHQGFKVAKQNNSLDSMEIIKSHMSKTDLFMYHCEENDVDWVTDNLAEHKSSAYAGFREAKKYGSREVADLLQNHLSGYRAEYNLDIDIKFLGYCYEGNIKALSIVEKHNVNTRIGALVADSRCHYVITHVLKRYLHLDFLQNVRPIIRAAVMTFNAELLEIIHDGGIKVDLTYAKTEEEKKFIIKTIF